MQHFPVIDKVLVRFPYSLRLKGIKVNPIPWLDLEELLTYFNILWFDSDFTQVTCQLLKKTD